MNDEPQQANQAALRAQAEARALGEATVSGAQMQIEQQRRLLHELRVHQIELEMQNETLREAQRELEASRDRYVELYEFAPVGYLTLDAGGFIEQINGCAIKLLGHERKQLLGKNFSHLVVDQDRLRWRELNIRLRKNSEPIDAKANLELILRRADGNPLPVRLHCAGQAADMPADKLRVVLTDISERRQAETALHESEFRFHQVLRSVSTVAVQGYRMDGRASYWNYASELLYGYSANEALGRNLLDLIIPPEMHATVADAMRQMAITGQPIPAGELTLKRKDGSRVSVISSHALLQKPGQEAELFCVDIDISERLLAESALRESDQTLRSILHATLDGYWRVDQHCGLLDVNDRYCALSGYTREQLLGRPAQDFDMLADTAESAARIQRVLDKGSDQFETLHRRRDGSVWPVEVSVTLHDSAEGGFVVFLRDISARRESAAALQSSLRDKEALLKEVHHRVKNNLQVITSLLRLEAGRSAVADTKAVLQAMQGRIRAMAQLHESLYRSGTFASVNLGSYLGQVGAQAFRAHLMDSCSVRLSLDMGSVLVGMDQAAACGLLINELISNGLKHGFSTEATGAAGEIKLGLQAHDGGAAQWCLSVSDNGVGLPADYETRRQASLGLQLVDDLTRQIGGTLSIRSAPGQGAEFNIVFKALAPAALVMPP
ncbi:PAS domain S-box protein [Roseateles oligotrophus]|uniref:histidine kinase n=1 Tax=Roseateles oligotrophus TaxID=1769250 RepID=A0ABT2YG20_9BURK|nr:PAS domain S-box protein [Roseateles oligotrophus]MCV2368920.1 PAS domain S-box protein [Roseateles oligotrophus]